MRKDLLLKAAELLEADAVNTTGVKFDLCNWARPADLEETGDLPPNDGPVAINCGTTACAMGLFALSGQFEGLKLELTQHFNSKIWIPVYRNVDDNALAEGYQAAVKLFDIPESDAENLFSPYGYTHTEGATAELEVARRIRDLVAADHT